MERVWSSGCVTASKENTQRTKQDRSRDGWKCLALYLSPDRRVTNANLFNPLLLLEHFLHLWVVQIYARKISASRVWRFSQGFIDWYGLRQKYHIRAAMPHSCCRGKDHSRHVATQISSGLLFNPVFGLRESESLNNGKPGTTAFKLTSLSRPAATVTMSPVSLLIVNIFCDGLCGVWVTMRYLTIPFAVVLSSASFAVTVIT